MTLGSLGRSTAALLVGAAVTAGLFWMLLNVPESNVLALILSAIITPDATLFTMLLMAVPLIVLYEIGIWGARLFGHRPTPGEQAAGGTVVGTAGTRERSS